MLFAAEIDIFPLWCYYIRVGEILHHKTRQAVMAHTTRKGGDSMPLTITFHAFGYVFTIRVKRENRHSAK